MIRRGYPVVLFAALAITGATVIAYAGGEKTTTANNTSTAKHAVTANSNGACTAEMAAKCTPEMAAACKSSGAHAAMAKKTNMAMTADNAADHCAKPSAAAAASSCCAMKGAKASATTAAVHGAKKSGAVTAGSSCSASKGKGAASTTAGYDAVVTGGGAACGGKGVGAMTGNSAHGCDACADMAMCESELKSAGSQYQVVPLKNGVMYVYTATDARDVRSVQTAISRRTDRINSLASVQGAKLCPDCKRMRGAMASGKLTREVVNIEGGSISLVTSSDPTMVTRLYAMAGLSGQKVIKS